MNYYPTYKDTFLTLFKKAKEKYSSVRCKERYLTIITVSRQGWYSRTKGGTLDYDIRKYPYPFVKRKPWTEYKR